MGRLEEIEKAAEHAVAVAREDVEVAQVRLTGAEERLRMVRAHRKTMESRDGQRQAETEAAS